MIRYFSIIFCGKEIWDLIYVQIVKIENKRNFGQKILILFFKRNILYVLRICLKKIIFLDVCCYVEVDFICERNEKIVYYMWDDLRKFKRIRNGLSNFIKFFRGIEWKIGELFIDN